MMPRIYPAAIAAMLLAGCGSLLTPQYERPDAPVPANWPTQGAYAGAVRDSDGSAIDTGWKTFVVDERARRLVAMALANNRDLRIAALNVERARAAYGVSRADLFPSVSAAGAATQAKGARDVVGESTGRISHNYSATLGFASYELDFFGKISNQADSSREAWLQQVETRDAAQISVIAQVVSGYLTLAADQERLKIAKDTLDSLQHTLRLTRKRHDVRVASQIDVASAQASVDGANVDIATYTTSVAQGENALALLIGSPLPDELRPPLGLFNGAPVLQEVPTGLSSEVLLRRPDLRADEHALKAANADIGAARAAFFPSISLTANAGSGSAELGRLFSGGNGIWTFAPQINLPIFTGGRLQSSLDQAEVARDIQVATYEKDVQTAFREVADALAQRGTADDALRAQRAQTDSYAQSYQLAELRYKNGVDSYLSVLVYQRSFYTAQLSLVSTRLLRQTNLVTLYKVLGGGVRE